MKKLNFLNENITITFLSLFIFVLIMKKIGAMINFKAIYISDDSYYLIKSDEIYYYNQGNVSEKYRFENNQIITSEEEFEMISIGIFKNNPNIANLIVVKNYVYAVLKDINFCNSELDQETGYREIYPYECTDIYCYYVYGFINSNKDLYLTLIRNPFGYCNSTLNYTTNINSVDSENLSCQYMQSSSNGKVLVCFYQNSNSKLMAINYEIDLDSHLIKNLTNLEQSKKNSGVKYIKSKLSIDETKCLVCYINKENKTDCLIYNIYNNTFSEYNTYLYDCLPKYSSLNIEYLDNSYFIYCYQSSTKYYLVKLNTNFKLIEDEKNGIYDLTDSLSNCQSYYLSSFILDSGNYSNFIMCNDNITKLEAKKTQNTQSSIYITNSIFHSSPLTTELKNKHSTIVSTTYQKNIYSTNLMTLSDSISTLISTFQYSNLTNNTKESNIIQKKISKSKEQIKDNINEIMENYETGKIYEIFGDDYNVKISPINNNNYKNISTYIDFLYCENKLRDYYNISKNDILTVLQIEINKNNENSLINQVEYAIFDINKKRLNLSICSNEPIKIYYSIKNSSALNISFISQFAENDIDIFNINDNFFNDICYPYTDTDSDSDLILKDRINDIYQNYSLCDSNCEYENIDIENMTIACNCSIKTEIEVVVEEPTFNKIIFGIFEDSTIGVIKCYKLVFNLNKKNNIGFWMFLIFILFHIPSIIHYMIFGIVSIKKYIKEEMIKYHYLENDSNPSKKKISYIKISSENDHIINSKNVSRNISRNVSQKNNLIISNNIIIYKKNKRKVNMYKNELMNNKTSTVSLTKRKESNKKINKFKEKKKIKKIKSNTNKKHNIQIKKKECCPNLYNMIKINADNSININYLSKYNLYSDDYEEAIKYEKRKFCKIFWIIIALKEKIINTFFFNSPLELKSIRICLLLFIYSSNFALNTIFYFSDKISDKYHYKDNDLFLFTIINNISISLISTLLSTIIITFLRIMTNSKDKIEKNFREEEKKMKNDKQYIIKKSRKIDIYRKINKILKSLKIKIIIFIIVELLLLLFFFYFTTAFCEVYKNTQVSWLIDCFTSFLMSIFIEILLSFLISILYVCSIKNKNRFIYKIISLLI